MALRHGTGRLSSFGGLIALAVSLAATAGCGHADGLPRAEPPADVTITGVIRAPERGHAVAGRVIQAVNMDTGQSIRSTTNDTGGYQVSVVPGRYRVNILLLPGESVLDGPDVIDAAGADARVRADFLLGTTMPEPRRPRPRQPAVLGAPSA
jgi:hypothetical protein